jgi:hypothetical protein
VFEPVSGFEPLTVRLQVCPWGFCGNIARDPGLVGILWGRLRPGFSHSGGVRDVKRRTWTCIDRRRQRRPAPPARTPPIPLRPPRRRRGLVVRLPPDRARRQASQCTAALSPMPAPPDDRDKGDQFMDCLPGKPEAARLPPREPQRPPNWRPETSRHRNTARRPSWR